MWGWPWRCYVTNQVCLSRASAKSKGRKSLNVEDFVLAVSEEETRDQAIAPSLVWLSAQQA